MSLPGSPSAPRRYQGNLIPSFVGSPAPTHPQLIYSNTRRNARASLEELKAAAVLGNTDAMVDLGLRLQARLEFDEARRLWLRAAGEGNARAMLSLGNSLSTTAPNEAATWYEKAARLGNSAAMFNLGVLAYKDVPPMWSRDLNLSRYWLEQAAAKGHFGAMGSLGELLWSSDRSRACALFEAAVANHSVPDMHNYGSLLRTSEPRRAVALWRQAAEAGFVPSMVALAALLPESDRSEAKEWFRKARTTEERPDPRVQNLRLPDWPAELDSNKERFAGGRSAGAVKLTRRLPFPAFRLRTRPLRRVWAKPDTAR